MTKTKNIFLQAEAGDPAGGSANPIAFRPSDLPIFCEKISIVECGLDPLSSINAAKVKICAVEIRSVGA